MNTRKIVTANDLRGALLATIEGVLCGKVNVAQANAVSALSGELHKSIKQGAGGKLGGADIGFWMIHHAKCGAAWMR